MLINYIKMAWKVLLRRKAFTAISLFGISFTMVVLLTATSFVDFTINPGAPNINQERLLVADRFIAKDSTGRSTWHSSPGAAVLFKFAKTLKTPELVSVHSELKTIFLYKEGVKHSFSYKYTDTEFWSIYKFNFTKGRPYNKLEYENVDFVAVVNQYIVDKFFNGENVIGKELEIDAQKFRIIGVVENVSVGMENCYSDIWIPTTTTKENLKENYIGGFKASVLAYSKDDFLNIQNEFLTNLKEAVSFLPSEENWHILKCELKSKGEYLRHLILNDENSKEDENTTKAASIASASDLSDQLIFYSALGLIMFLFMLLPSINLVNINMSRIVERHSEIGVRKAFGASQSNLIRQFVIENIILTLLGGILSFGLTVIVLEIINDAQIIKHTILKLNFNVFLMGLIISFIFGLMSGVYPAIKMSRTHPVEALRGGDK